MGIIRESNQTLDNPRHSDILIDDISETITIMARKNNRIMAINVFDYDQYEMCQAAIRNAVIVWINKAKGKLKSEMADIFSYDEYDQLAENGRRGARAGRRLKNETNV